MPGGRGGGAANQARAWAIGLNFVYGVIGFSLIGWAVQRWIWPSAAPWPLLVGLFLGLIGGGFRFIKDAMSIGRR
ncbi:MAG: AtpZ/AtpI family protein [Phycisphaeraceae bacterium]|nr:AtpZ/AtpI family protein [Phycisphaerae bacterium]MBX3392537.1 AtpZ/AtpI family protein [Phycisphaeraceae bacterium]HRJ49066.1 AtpZ/AtpI family protein [Phycisphaerales bacterium]